MNEFSAKAMAVSAIWIATALICIFSKLTDSEYLLFAAAGVTSYYIWTWNRETGQAGAQPNKFEEIAKWNDLREKRMITQAEYDEKKSELLEL